MINSKPKIIGPVVLVTGPTASGKSDLALELAKELNGEIINIDSVQIYRYADIGSAKPTLEERNEVPSHLFDICDPSESMNASVFAGMARKTVEQVIERKRVPILVGSSGLYVAALFSGLPKLPKRDEKLRAELEGKESQELHALLEEREPKIAARLHKNDRVRVIRALEISITGDRTAEILQADEVSPLVFGAIVVITSDRKDLYQRINQRADQMVTRGLMKEALLIKEKFGANCGMLQSLGYSQALSLGETPGLAEEIALHTRRYAKRQITFWINEPAKRGWKIRPDVTDQDAVISEGTRPSRVFTWQVKRIAHELRAILQQKTEENNVFFIQPHR